ncbi:MAG: hypothetical protein HY985_00765 [Magnetospirillum sp.]|nr:hypothetical protein [Magnetospirillum sp.]
MIRRLTILALVVALAVPLAACGRKGRPIAPENSVYPRTYPPITFDGQPAAAPKPAAEDDAAAESNKLPPQAPTFEDMKR